MTKDEKKALAAKLKADLQQVKELLVAQEEGTNSLKKKLGKKLALIVSKVEALQAEVAEYEGA